MDAPRPSSHGVRHGHLPASSGAGGYQSTNQPSIISASMLSPATPLASSARLAPGNQQSSSSFSASTTPPAERSPSTTPISASFRNTVTGLLSAMSVRTRTSSLEPSPRTSATEPQTQPQTKLSKPPNKQKHTSSSRTSTTDTRPTSVKAATGFRVANGNASRSLAQSSATPKS